MKAIILGCKDYPAFKHASDVGGIEIFCNEVLPRLDDIEFHLFTRRYKNAAKYEKIDNVNVTRVPFLNLPMLQTFTFNFFSLFKARKVKADVIWAHEPVAGFYAYFLSKLKGIPYILHIHSRGSLEPANINRRFWMKVMERYAYKNAKQVIFVSDNIKNDLNKQGIVIPVGVDIKKFDSMPIDHELSSIKGKKICFIGRLHRVKGLNYLLEAFSQLKEDASLVIVGDGEEKSRLIELAKRLSIYDRVYFLGYKPSASILPYIDIFVLPSLSEGLPNSVLEAIACKKPVVATSVGDIPKLVSHYLVNPEDTSGLFLAIQKALKEKKLEELPKEYAIDDVITSIKKILN